MEKVSDALDRKQKRQFISNLLQEMKRTGQIQPKGADPRGQLGIV